MNLCCRGKISFSLRLLRISTACRWESSHFPNDKSRTLVFPNHLSHYDADASLFPYPAFRFSLPRLYAAPAKVKKKEGPGKEEDKQSGPRLNEAITAKAVRLVTEEGHHVVPLHEALNFAKKFDLDLVEVQRQANPPVCKVMDYNKEKFLQKKREKEQAKTESSLRKSEPREIQFTTKIGKNDLERKAKTAKELMERGYRVKCVAKGKGNDNLEKVLQDILPLIEDVAYIEVAPRVEKRTAFFLARHIKFSSSSKAKQKSCKITEDMEEKTVDSSTKSNSVVNDPKGIVSTETTGGHLQFEESVKQVQETSSFQNKDDIQSFESSEHESDSFSEHDIKLTSSSDTEEHLTDFNPTLPREVVERMGSKSIKDEEFMFSDLNQRSSTNSDTRYFDASASELSSKSSQDLSFSEMDCIDKSFTQSASCGFVEGVSGNQSKGTSYRTSEFLANEMPKNFMPISDTKGSGRPDLDKSRLPGEKTILVDELKEAISDLGFMQRSHMPHNQKTPSLNLADMNRNFVESGSEGSFVGSKMGFQKHNSTIMQQNHGHTDDLSRGLRELLSKDASHEAEKSDLFDLVSKGTEGSKQLAMNKRWIPTPDEKNKLTRFQSRNARVNSISASHKCEQTPFSGKSASPATGFTQTIVADGTNSGSFNDRPVSYSRTTARRGEHWHMSPDSRKPAQRDDDRQSTAFRSQQSTKHPANSLPKLDRSPQRFHRDTIPPESSRELAHTPFIHSSGSQEIFVKKDPCQMNRVSASPEYASSKLGSGQPPTSGVSRWGVFSSPKGDASAQNIRPASPRIRLDPSSESKSYQAQYAASRDSTIEHVAKQASDRNLEQSPSEQLNKRFGIFSMKVPGRENDSNENQDN